MDESDAYSLPLYSCNQRKIEELTQQLRHLQLNSESAISSLHTQLQAEREKSQSLESALVDKSDAELLQARLREAEEVERRLRTDMVKIARHSMVDCEGECAKSRAQELETENFLLTQKIKGLEKQLRDVKNNAVIVTQLLIVKEKETALTDLQLKCGVLITENVRLKGDMEDVKKLMDDVQRRRDDLKCMNEELAAQAMAAISSRQTLENESKALLKLSEDSKSALERKHLKETAKYAEKISRLTLRLNEKDEELVAMQRKVIEAKSYKGRIFDDVQQLEENLGQMQETIASLRKQLAEKTKEIEALNYAVSCSRQESRHFQELIDARRKNGEVISGLKEKERKLDSELTTMADNLQKYQQENRDLSLKLTSVEKEKAQLADNCESLRRQIVEISSELKLAQDRGKKMQEETKQEMIARVIELRQEKLGLEAKLEELQDQIGGQRRSFYETPSLMDEIKQLEDISGYKPSRFSISSHSNELEKQLESFRLELTEKDFLLKNAMGEIDNLKQEIASLTGKLTQMDEICSELRKENEKMEDELSASIAEMTRLQERMLANETARVTQNRGSHGGTKQTETLQAELKRLQTELLLSKEMWAEENNSLRGALLDAEKTAVEATTKYAEAAADRDSFIKKYRDLAHSRDHKSTKY